MTRSCPARLLHGMVSVMTAAESARDLLSSITQPVSYSELASHLARDYSVELFGSLSGLVLCHLDELSGPELSNLLWAYSTVGHRDPGLASCVMTSLSGKLSELGPSEMANALWALPRLGLYDPQFVSAASEHVWDGLPSATPRQLAAIVQSYAWFRQQDPALEEDEDLLRSVGAKFRQQLPTATATDVALVLSGMARLRRADVGLLEEACALLRGVADDADLHALAEAIWSLALLQHLDLGLLELVTERVAEVLRHATGLSGQGPISGGGSGVDVGFAVAAGAGARGVVPGAVQTRRHESQQQPRGDVTEFGAVASRPTPAAALVRGPSGGSATVRFSGLRPTPLGPSGRRHTCSLYERFNPSLPDHWEAADSAANGSLGSSVASHAQGSSLQAARSLGQVAAESQLGVDKDIGALSDPEVVSKLLWSYGVLHCHSNALNTLLFRQLQRMQPDAMSWSTLARLMGAQAKALELQPSPGICRINPLEAESVTAWGRLLRSRVPAHKLPGRYLAPCFVAFTAEEMGRDSTGPCSAKPPATAGAEAAGQQVPGAPLSRVALQAEVASALQDMGLQLRPSATVDGLFGLEHTVLINGLTICLEVLSAGCCTLDPPHRPMGPAVARLRSLDFRGWTLLVVPFYEWAALAPEDSPPVWARQPGPESEAERLRALQEASAARQRYLRRKLEDLLGEKLPPMPFAVPKHRKC